MNPQWLNWLDVPSRFTASDGNRLIEFAERIAARALTVTDPTDGLRTSVGEIAAELGAQQVAVVERTPEWVVLAQQGRWPTDDIPWPFVLESLDREAAGLRAWTQGGTTGRFAVAPVRSQHSPTAMLLLAGRSLPDDVLAELSLIARSVGLAWDIAQKQAAQQTRITQLRGVLSIAAAIASFPEVEPLLERIAEEATRLLDCDRASIFLWDQGQKELVARPALGVEGGSLRISDKVGVVGEVLATGQPSRVDDAYADKRFSQVVDRASGYVTQNLMCVPLSGADRERLGVFEVINKRGGPFTDDDLETVQELSVQIAAVLQNTREREVLLRSHQQLTEQVSKGATIIGDSAALSAVRSTIGRLAGTDLPVLILGESGTGKEVVASALHYQGPRASRPFVAVNCAALTETLLESELFGHEKGAFTDAHEMRRGKFELAEGGTIFLDEIGDMSLGGQAKLLRVLEQKVITRVGGSQAIPINVRVVAATNARLAEAVRNRKFREDLYYRLNVVTVDLPPLRDRADDIIPLAEHFLKLFAGQARRPRLHLSAEAKKRLQAHHWPGNVRELRNLMERVAFLSTTDKIEANDLAFILSPEKPSFFEPMDDQGLSEATNNFQQVYIRRAIQRVRGNMSEAAKLLGLHRSNLYRKMRQLGMSEAGEEGDEEVEG